MRLVDGADIGALLGASGHIAPERAVYLISQAAEALDAAHADHLVHRDIKPSNILVTSSDFVYVVDFGIARSIGGPETPLTITGVTIGTLALHGPGAIHRPRILTGAPMSTPWLVCCTSA